MIRLVVFDCDGTLIDSQHAIVEAMRRAFRAHRLPAPEAGAVRRTVGLSLPKAMAALWPDGEAAEHAALVDGYRTVSLELRADAAHREPFYPGAIETIERLSRAGYLLGVATGKSRRGLHATLERSALLDRFVTLQTADDAPSKPHPGMLEQAMAEAGVGADETALVGDTTYDMEMAANARTTAIGVSWGYHEISELYAAGADTVVASFDELAAAISTIDGTLAPC